MIINHCDHTHIYTTMCNILKSYIWREKEEGKVEISQISKWHFKINVHTEHACYDFIYISVNVFEYGIEEILEMMVTKMLTVMTSKLWELR